MQQHGKSQRNDLTFTADAHLQEQITVTGLYYTFSLERSTLDANVAFAVFHLSSIRTDSSGISPERVRSYLILSPCSFR